jgi:hypothetical protein
MSDGLTLNSSEDRMGQMERRVSTPQDSGRSLSNRPPSMVEGLCCAIVDGRAKESVISATSASPKAQASRITLALISDRGESPRGRYKDPKTGKFHEQSPARHTTTGGGIPGCYFERVMQTTNRDWVRQTCMQAAGNDMVQ